MLQIYQQGHILQMYLLSIYFCVTVAEVAVVVVVGIIGDHDDDDEGPLFDVLFFFC